MLTYLSYNECWALRTAGFPQLAGRGAAAEVCDERADTLYGYIRAPREGQSHEDHDFYAERFLQRRTEAEQIARDIRALTPPTTDTPPADVLAGVEEGGM